MREDVDGERFREVGSGQVVKWFEQVDLMSQFAWASPGLSLLFQNCYVTTQLIGHGKELGHLL